MALSVAVPVLAMDRVAMPRTIIGYVIAPPWVPVVDIGLRTE